MTGIPVDHRFENHRNGYKSAWVVRKYGVRLMSELYEHLNPMPFEAAVQMEIELADDLSKIVDVLRRRVEWQFHDAQHATGNDERANLDIVEGGPDHVMLIVDANQPRRPHIREIELNQVVNPSHGCRGFALRGKSREAQVTQHQERDRE